MRLHSRTSQLRLQRIHYVLRLLHSALTRKGDGTDWSFGRALRVSNDAFPQRGKKNGIANPLKLRI